MKSTTNNGEGAGGRAPSGGGGSVGKGRPRRGRPPVNETLQHVIGSQLKAAYDEVVRQPIPDRFIELLGALEDKKRGGSE
jgi:Anti-sigma factor NepR